MEVRWRWVRVGDIVLREASGIIGRWGGVHMVSVGGSGGRHLVAFGGVF